MSRNLEFNKVKEKHLKTLLQYVPIVNKVHGKNHIEFNDVNSVFNEIHNKIEQSTTITPNLTEEFKSLREITNNYKVPSDVCESYEAVYNMLSELDQSYHQ